MATPGSKPPLTIISVGLGGEYEVEEDVVAEVIVPEVEVEVEVDDDDEMEVTVLVALTRQLQALDKREGPHVAIGDGAAVRLDCVRIRAI